LVFKPSVSSGSRLSQIETFGVSPTQKLAGSNALDHAARRDGRGVQLGIRLHVRVGVGVRVRRSVAVRRINVLDVIQRNIDRVRVESDIRSCISGVRSNFGSIGLGVAARESQRERRRENRNTEPMTRE
jgi:hypothetical protein